MFPEKVQRNNLLLDLDGPILDVSERYYRVYKKIIEEIGGRPLDKKTYWRCKRKKIDLSKMLCLSAIKKDKALLFRREWLNRIERKSFLTYDRIWPYTRDTLKKLSIKHKLILITLRRSPANLNWQLRRLKLKGYFDSILCQGNNKGDWRVKYDLARRAGLHCACSFLIGDTEIDILSGKKSGAKTIALLSGVRCRDILRRYKPDYILNSLRETNRVLD
ncbi:MAG: HAD hydrolase-like protein [Candidatus Omnitrophota bacterium]